MDEQAEGTGEAEGAVMSLLLRDERLTREDYGEAIGFMRDAATQLRPDGRCCQVCGDNDHQAFECRFNPLRLARVAFMVGLHLPRSAHGDGPPWICFHCGEECWTLQQGREHFGAGPHERPVCRVNADAKTIRGIVAAVREALATKRDADDADQAAYVMVRHLLRGVPCEGDDAKEEAG